MHIEKETYKEAIIKLKHDLRQSSNYKNKDIDLSKTKFNYHYGDWNVFEKFQKRLDEIYIYGRNGKNKDSINYLISVVVQYPDDCPIDEQTFFTYFVNIMCRRYGKENLISAVVHKDEGGKENKGKAHLHYKFIPVIKLDEPNKKGYTEKLCAKEVINREMLQSFHQDIENDFFKYYNVKLSLRSKEHRKYVNDIYEFKELQKENEELQGKNEELKNKYNYLVSIYNKLLKKIENIKEYIRFEKLKERTK